MSRCLLPKRNRVTERREKATETFDGPFRSSLIHAYSRPFDPCFAPTTVSKDGRTLCVWDEFVFSAKSSESVTRLNLLITFRFWIKDFTFRRFQTKESMSISKLVRRPRSRPKMPFIVEIKRLRRSIGRTLTFP